MKWGVLLCARGRGNATWTHFDASRFIFSWFQTFFPKNRNFERRRHIRISRGTTVHLRSSYVSFRTSERRHISPKWLQIFLNVLVTLRLLWDRNVCKVTDDVERAKIPRRAAREVKLEESASHHEVGCFPLRPRLRKCNLNAFWRFQIHFFLIPNIFPKNWNFERRPQIRMPRGTTVHLRSS